MRNALNYRSRDGDRILNFWYRASFSALNAEFCFLRHSHDQMDPRYPSLSPETLLMKPITDPMQYAHTTQRINFTGELLLLEIHPRNYSLQGNSSGKLTLYTIHRNLLA